MESASGLYRYLETLWNYLRPGSTERQGATIRNIETILTVLESGYPEFPRLLRYNQFNRNQITDSLVTYPGKEAWKRYLAVSLVRSGWFAELPPPVTPEGPDPRYREPKYIWDRYNY